MKKILYLTSLLFFSFFFGQTEVLKIKKYQIATLSDTLRENSGLTFFDNNLMTINDGGNTSDIFEIDKNSGKILDIIKTNLQNKDWEAIASDDNYIYIGDFGNNGGDRRDLTIIKIPMAKVTLTVEESFENQNLESENKIERISFLYPEQIDFSGPAHNHDFDAEAMIILDGKIHLFTKEWKSKSTTHYILETNQSENQPAKKLETFDVGFLVTDADFFQNRLYLVGYTKIMEVFMMVFERDKNGLFFSSAPQKFNLGSTANVGQIEGISVSKDGIFISGEQFHRSIFKAPASLYHIPFQNLQQNDKKTD